MTSGRDQTSSALYGVLSRKMPPGLPLGHLVFIDKRSLPRNHHVKRVFLIRVAASGQRDQTSSALYGVLSRKMPPGFSRSAIWYLSMQLVAQNSLRNQIR